MGWNVIALGGIELPDMPIDDIEKIVQKIKALDKDEYVIKCNAHKDYIDVELSGNKSVSYDVLKKVAKDLQNKKIKFDINLGEYSETGDGLYINSEEEIEIE